jgi:hypothetical protein
MKMKGTIKIDDPQILDMDPVQKMWMYENWLADQKEEAELAKNHAYLLASFWNPEAVKQILGDGNVHVSTDEEFEESTRLVKEINEKVRQAQQSNKKRKRRTVKG